MTVSPPAGSRAEPAWLAPVARLLCVGVFVVLAVWSWGGWPDVLVDFGRELYVPWQLASGASLYTDVAWFNGPLSPYWNALVFRWFGVGLAQLVWSNLAIGAGVAALFYWLLRRVGDTWAAAAGTIVFLCVFGFGHLVGTGNYNFVTPYSHEVTHGLLLSLLALACTDRAFRRASPSGSPRTSGAWLFAAGALVGLVALTKAEVLLAAASGVVACAVANAGPRGAWSAAVRLALGASLPPLAAWAALSLAMPASEALRGLLGAWPGILAGEAGSLRFYRHWLGLDAPGENLASMAGELGWLLVWLAPAALIDRALAGRTRFAPWLAVGVFAFTCVLLWYVSPVWLRVGRSLPVVALGFAALAGLRCARAEGAPARSVAALALGFAVFAFALLAKMILFTRLFHYGFALAAPAALVFVVAAVAWLPAALRRRGAPGSVLRAAALGLLVAAVIGLLQVSGARYRAKTLTIARGADAFAARAPDGTPLAQRGTAVRELLAVIERRVAPNGTLLVLPEGVMLNYLSRRRSPTPYVNFLPPELILFGEDALVAALDRSPPDAVVLIHKDTTEYGYPLFGRDYGRALMAWVRARYTPVGPALGDPPLQPGSRFGAQWLEPKPR